MYEVYALKSEKDGRIYKEHNSGFVFSTKGYRPWKLIYRELVGARIEARKREKYWKSGIGKERLKSIPL